ncbi:MAG: hypothetical protein CME62_13305 [Halobacteriovoraceae bacterium]|nr:hypothetical protein [Halobacteriovoraceae bacterium]|tara:strand:- start:6530 stop:7516 length:987 start_codon:yes stop_codon:yes gene_type:complete
MKALTLFLISASLVSCSKHQADKKVIDPTQGLLPQVKSFADIKSEIGAKNQKNICEYTAFSQEKKQFDLVIGNELSEQIREELEQSFIAKQDINYEDFWNNISDDSAERLNELLLIKYAQQSDDDFRLKKNLVATALNYYTTEDIRPSAFDIQYTPDETLSIAFDEKARLEESKQIHLCGNLNPLQMKFSDNYEMELELPSDITALVQCVNKDHSQQIYLKVIQGEEVQIRVRKDEELAYYFTSIREMSGSSRFRSAQLKFDAEGDEVKLKITKKYEMDHRRRGLQAREYLPATIDKLKFERKGVSGKLKTKTLKCNTIKDFIYERVE